MLTLQQLYERAEAQGIEIDDFSMVELRAVSFPEGWIAIDKRKFTSAREFKCVLAHEIGHCETGSFYNVYSSFDLKSKCEFKANKRAVQILMPLHEVRQAIADGYSAPWALAEYFDVTEDFAVMALKIYVDDLQHSDVRKMHAVGLAGIPNLIKARQLIRNPIRTYDDWKDDVYLKLNTYDDY